MAGLFATLNLGARALQVQQQGMEVAGHNLANVNNPAYARQRVNIATSITLPTLIGPQGTGADVVSIQQLRDALLDGQIVSEASVRGFLEASQRALQLGEAILGQSIDRLASGTEGASAAEGVGNQFGLAEGLSDLFNAFQSLSTDPASLSERQSVLAAAQDLAAEFNRIDARLANLDQSLNQSLQSDVSRLNELLASIANDNKQIISIESGTNARANDLRDSRQQKIEELGELVDLQVAVQSNGAIDIAISGVTVVSGTQVSDRLELYDAGGGQMLLRTQSGNTPAALTGGSIQGTIDARDSALRNLRSGLNTLASTLITEVNAIHAAGYGLTGSTGASFFTGASAADVAVNQDLINDPRLLQASGTSGASGDNQVALALARLADKTHSGLSGQTFSGSYAQTVAGIGQAIASTNNALSDQQAVDNMLLRQRDAVSGVSLDEEMTDLMKFQRAFEASARLITTIDEMMDTVINM